jgi:hypothetical protein
MTTSNSTKVNAGFCRMEVNDSRIFGTNAARIGE